MASDRYRIPGITLPTLTEEEYWQGIAIKPQVRPLTKPCADCAIETGFYLELAQSLKRQSKELQEKVASTWFCHNNCNRGCRGLIEFLK
jgi:hypothetical protein